MMHASPHSQPHDPTMCNRIRALMQHVPRYSFKGFSRLAADAGISKSAVSRVVRCKACPSYALVVRIVGALERQLGRKLDLRDVVRIDGSYPTPFTCDVVGCNGCLPEWAYNEHGRLKPEYAAVRPGEWVGDEVSQEVHG